MTLAEKREWQRKEHQHQQKMFNMLLTLLGCLGFWGIVIYFVRCP